MGRFSRLGPKTPGADPDYASSYESRSGGAVDVTQYWGDGGVDMEKSMKLAEYRKMIGPSMDNKIMGLWLKAKAEDPYGTYRLGKNKFQATQDYFLQYEAPLLEEKIGLRSAHQAAKNPMLY